MPWVLRGLRNGVVTTGYPKRADEYEAMFRSAPVVVGTSAAAASSVLLEVCPTGAISRDAGGLRLDQGRCILCGRCVQAYPGVFRWGTGSETGALHRETLVVPPAVDSARADVEGVREALAARVRRLRRSVHIRHVDAGSDGSEEWEIQALTNPTYDVHRLGIFFTASPRHADILMVTGAGAHGMIGPLRRTREAMPDPVVVIAVGTDAISGGLVTGGYATRGGVASELAVDVFVPGSPPPPFAILHAILLALGRVPARERSTR